MATITPDDVLAQALAQDGDRYIFGTETSPLDPNPDAFDCSELVEWSCARAGVSPKVPDGAFYQWRHARGVTVAQGIATRGALLFVGDGTGVGRDAITHVAFSLGDGTTIEARGRKWGVGTWAAPGRFSFAGLIPGVNYSAHPAPRPPNQGGGLVLGPGSRGASVRFLQAMLNIVTPYRKGKRIAEDGEYGPQTQAAVAEFDRFADGMAKLAGGKGVPQDNGLADATTASALAWWVPAILGQR